MKNIFIHFAIFLISIQINVFGQNMKTKDNFNYLVREETGDLNADGETDSVTVYMDTIDKTYPLKLQIFLSQPN